MAATLATFPLALSYFHQGNVAAPLVNLLAVPITGLLALPLGLLGIVSLAFGLPGARWLLQLSGWLLEQLIHLTEQLLTLPLLSGSSFYPSLVQLIAIWLLVAVLLLPWRRGKSSRQLQLLCLVTALLLLLLPNRQSSELRVTSLSVGQGEATLVSLGSRHLLIDGGGFYGSQFDVGQRLLAPALGRLGVTGPSTIILSHNHPDHSLGLEYLLTRSKDPQLLTTVARAELPYRPELLRRLNLDVPNPGWQTLFVDEHAELQLFVPDQQADNLNDRSLVLYARNGADGLLLSGDLANDGVTQLLEQPPPGPVTLLKLPHHGSRYSHSERLLDQLHPLKTFVSAGRDNRFGLPSATIVQALEQRHIPLWRTDLDGSLQFRSHGNGWQVRSWENWLFH